MIITIIKDFHISFIFYPYIRFLYFFNYGKLTPAFNVRVKDVPNLNFYPNSRHKSNIIFNY